MMRITQETKAALAAERGSVIGFVKSSEPRRISLAVPGDRAVLTPAQARQLAYWLTVEAEKADSTRINMQEHADAEWRTAEAKQRAAILAQLDGKS